MKRLGKFLLLCALCASAATATAQSVSMAAGWGGLIPVGGGNFLNHAAWVAPSLDLEYHPLPWLSAGVRVGLLSACENAVTRDRWNGDLVDGYTRRRSTVVPIRAQLRYYPLGRRGGKVRPFIAAAAGASYARSAIEGDMISASRRATWGALFSAGLGVRFYPVRKGFFLELASGWQWRGNKFKELGSTSQRSVEVRLSAGFTL